MFFEDLDSDRLPVNELVFDEDRDPIRASTLRFLSCGTLRSLKYYGSFEDVWEGDYLKDALTRGNLQSLVIPIGSLAQLGPSLRQALTVGSLTSLEIPWFHRGHADEDFEGLIFALKSEACKLQHFRVHLDRADGTPIHEILKALGGVSELTSLQLDVDHNEDAPFHLFLDTVAAYLPKLESLTAFRLSRFGEIEDVSQYLQQEQTAASEGNLLTAVAEHWELESVCIYVMPDSEEHYYDHNHQRPYISAGSEKKLDGYMFRNLTKKTIDGLSQDNTTAQKKTELINAMESFWETPDGLTLAFLLLQKMPGWLRVV